ncbi:MAG: hypothetical protein N2746_07885 [Deltaproteobacteria bacterium]|nr:hypothetical protein [Deltaproteobacteria bacterium]
MEKYIKELVAMGIIVAFSCSENKLSTSLSDSITTEDATIVDINPNRCSKKSDCETGMHCNKDKGICEEGECFDNTDCREGYACDSARHYCYFVGCSKSADCKQGVCKRSTGQCIGCLFDTDCKSGSCNSALGECIDNNCIDDKLEPNDSFSQAYSLEGGVRKLKLCPKDDDFFKLSLSYKDKLRININTSSIKNIPLYLFFENDLKNPIAYTLIKNSGELTVPMVTEPGNYYIKVESPDSEINYEIGVEIESSISSCNDDIFENNDSESTSKDITSGVYKELILCPKDIDYYSFNLNNGEKIEISISGDNILSEFYDTSGGKNNLPINSKTSIEIQSSGKYFLKIFSNSDIEQRYTINIAIITNNSRCIDDGYEDNDSFNKSMEIPLNKEIYLTICPSDNDYFMVKTYRRPTKIILKSSKNIPFEIYSPNDNSEPLLYSESTDTSTEVAEFENLPETVILKVPQSSTAEQYTLKVETPLNTCVDDNFEPNNTTSGARRLEMGSYSSLMLCPSDEDYYSFLLNTNDRIEIETRFDNTKADIDLILLNPQLKEVSYSITSTGIEKINHTSDMSGNYILNVFSWDNGSTPYQMNVKIIKNQTCSDDRFEDNDSINTAKKLNSDEIYGLVICPSDADYYSVTLNKGDRLSTGVFYSETKGKLYSALLSFDGKTVFATGETQSGDIILNTTATYSGEYILLVKGADKSIKNDYDILIDIKRNTVCSDDIYEENDSIQYAPAIAKGTLSQLTLCPLDTDIYKVYLNAKDIILSESTVTNLETAEYTISLIDPAGRILDTSTGVKKTKSLIAEIATTGYYYIIIKNNTNNTLSYKLTIQVDGVGGNSGDETISIYPFDKLDKGNPGLYELKYLRVPTGAIVENLYLSLIVEHKSVGDIIITAQYSNANEVLLWDGYGSTTDKGFDDDKEDDGDIELYNRPITTAKGRSAKDSLLLMIEDISNTSGTIFAIEGKMFWKIK